MITYRNIRSPCTDEDVRLMRMHAGNQMAHHMKARWWNLRAKVETLISARAYARRSLEGPQS